MLTAYASVCRLGDPRPPDVAGEALFDWIAERLCEAVVDKHPERHPAVVFAVEMIVRYGVELRPWLDQLCLHLDFDDVERLIDAAGKVEVRLVIVIGPRDEQQGKAGYILAAYRVEHPPGREVMKAKVTPVEGSRRELYDDDQETLDLAIGDAISRCPGTHHSRRALPAHPPATAFAGRHPLRQAEGEVASVPAAPRFDSLLGASQPYRLPRGSGIPRAPGGTAGRASATIQPRPRTASRENGLRGESPWPTI